MQRCSVQPLSVSVVISVFVRPRIQQILLRVALAFLLAGKVRNQPVVAIAVIAKRIMACVYATFMENTDELVFHRCFFVAWTSTRRTQSDDSRWSSLAAALIRRLRLGCIRTLSSAVFFSFFIAGRIVHTFVGQVKRKT
jgi:hypothetical protein